MTCRDREPTSSIIVLGLVIIDAPAGTQAELSDEGVFCTLIADSGIDFSTDWTIDAFATIRLEPDKLREALSYGRGRADH